MKKFFTLLFLSVTGITGFAQTAVTDSLKEVISTHEGKLTALDDRVLVNEADLAKLNKIKV